MVVTLTRIGLRGTPALVVELRPAHSRARVRAVSEALPLCRIAVVRMSESGTSRRSIYEYARPSLKGSEPRWEPKQ